MTKDELQQILTGIHSIDLRLSRLEERTRDLQDIHDRINALEKWRERLVGISMAVGSISALLTGVVLWGLAKLFGA